MTDQEINAAVAEACGWENVREEEYPHRWLWRKDGEGGMLFDEPNDYCTDLNAIAEAIRSNPHYIEEFFQALYDVLERYWTPARWHLFSKPQQFYAFAMATARQRAEAFLRTVGKWRDA